MSQITTCTFFKVEGFPNKIWAFKQMQLGLKSLKKIPGLSFYKLLGSGAENGFSAIPNFGTYVLFCVWESETYARDFFLADPFFMSYNRRSKEQFTAYLHFAESNGTWDQLQPFTKHVTLACDKPVLILTRATIRFRKLWSFWRRVGKVSESLDGYSGRLFSIGVGEWPLIQQATISIWKTQAEMLDFAYKNQHHKQVVSLTRKLNWYKEEMFARFVPFKFEGIWEGKNMATLIE